jgi:large subunit ribosomal protein L21
MPYAIIRTGGKQFRAESGKTIRIPTLEGEAGSKITFDDVILGSDGDTTHVGAPGVQGARVTGEIVKHGKGDKIVVFKHKRRKNYAKKQGHRQGFTEVRINDVSFGKKSGADK